LISFLISIVYCNNSCDFVYPKHYINYFTSNPPIIDGKLDDEAWKEVSWTDPFMDIQGIKYPVPRFLTKAKMRFDDHWLYIGAYIQETQVWAYQTKHDSVVFLDNDFEVFINPDGSTHYYKEFEMNALNTTWDLILDKPYMNGGYPNSTWDMKTMKTGVYIDGKINDPSIQNVFWSVEIAFPLKDLAFNNSVHVPPKNGDYWRINFSRVEWHVNVVNGKYVKIPNLPEDNWVWSSQAAINMHIPERWGFIQFSRQPVNTTKWVPDPQWPVRYILAQLYDGEVMFKAVNGYFTNDITQLNLPNNIIDGHCAGIPNLNISFYQFQIDVSSLDPKVGTGHIRDDRYTWFTH